MNETADVIVLAGRREGQIDALAACFGETEKCLVPVAGRKLIEHVLLVLAQSEKVGRIVISINDPLLLQSLQVVQQLEQQHRITVLAARGNLADSVFDAAAQLSFPIIVTTADNALLTQAALGEFFAANIANNADAAAAFARRSSVLSAHPDGQRRFYEMADDAYSNCNCYWVGSEPALKAAEVFRSGGQFKKNPMRIAQSFGLWNLIAMRLGILSLASSFARISKKLGLRVMPVVFEDGALAIDVDNERSHRIVEEILLSRQGELVA